MIKVIEHDPNWRLKFELEAQILKNILGDVLIDIHHIGSTSVTGLHAKPIIDILLEASDLSELDSKNKEMESIGYEVMGEFGIPGRRYFRKGKDVRTHHVHSFVSGDPGLIRHIAFRDYLIAHSDIAKEYGLLKTEIIKRNNHDMGFYCDAKDPFISLHEPKAVEWYMNRSQTAVK